MTRRELRREKIKLFMIVLVLISFMAIGNYVEHTYTMNGTVIEVKDDVQYIVDETDNVWTVEDEAIEVGDNVRIKFYDEMTSDNRCDDSIEKVTRQ